MLPTFNKKFNAERSAKRIAARFPGVEALGAVEQVIGGVRYFLASVQVPADHPEIEQVKKIAAVNILACFPDNEETEATFSHQAEIAPVPIMATECGRELLPGELVEPIEIEAARPIPVEQFARSFPVTVSTEDQIRARREDRQGQERKARQGRLFTKKTAVLNLLAAGCTNEQIRAATGWQWNTVKGFISTQRSLGRKITTEMRDGIAFYKMEG